MNEYLLPYRPILQEDESPASFLIRAAEGNGFSSILQLMSACGVNSNGLGSVRATLTDPNRYGVLLRALGLKADYSCAAFQRSKPTRASPRILLGTVVPERLFRDDATVFCPKCLAEQPYWRRLWTLRPYTVCHIHSVLLLQNCPGCKRTPALNREHLTVCECDTNWQEACSTPCDPSPSRWLYDQLTLQSQQLLNECFAFWIALNEFDNLGEGMNTELWRLRLMIAWGENLDISREEVKRIVLDRASQHHPRVQLLPFLKRKGQLASFARQVLSRLQDVPPVSSPSPTYTVRMSAQEAAYALGVNNQQIREFLEKGIFSKPAGSRSDDASVAIDEVEDLLMSLQPTKSTAEKHRHRPPNLSLADLISDIRHGRVMSAGYDLDKGLNYLRIREHPIAKLPPAGSLGAWEVSLALDVHPEVVRSLVKKGWLTGISQVVAGSRKLAIHSYEVERFNSEYITAGALARSIQINTTNFAEKLEYLGISPVAGPRLDGTLVYLFRRADIIGVDLLSLKSLHGYGTRTGRKTLTTATPTEPGILLTDASSRLQISVQQASALLRHGILKEEPTISRDVRVTEASLWSLLEVVFSPEFMLLKEAAEITGYSEHQFQVYFIETEVVKVIDLHIWKLVHGDELTIPMALKKLFLPAADAGAILGMHRSFLPNLERRGEITPQVIGKKRKVKFYSREIIRQVAEKLGISIDLDSDVKPAIHDQLHP